MGDMLPPIAPFANDHGHPLDPPGGGSGHASVLFHQMAQAALHVRRKVIQELLIHPVERRFEEPPLRAIRDFVHQ